MDARDAKEQVRRYLEQRREMGETELVLDGMTVEQAMSLLAGGVGREERRAKSEERLAPIAPAAAGVARQVGDPQIGGDWRAALRATGAAPDNLAKKPSAVTPPTPPVPTLPPAEVEITPASYANPTYASLDEIAKTVASCTKCPLYKTATNPVPGEGNPNADFMCVGEAPGATEDETGRPFVGAAGQLLTKILGAIGLQREDVFICNVLKHRPPGNRNPMPDEVTACSPYLIRQIELIRPKVILALGTFAAQTLLNTKTPIGKLRGQVHRYHGVPLIVTYHPAALLRNPSWKRPTWEDVQLAHRILNSAPEPRA